jgi:hypothetical protein
MRPARLLLGLTLCFSWNGLLLAETPPSESAITVPEVEVRSGPSSDAKFYPTSKLHQGDRVQILKEEEGGWLAIKPPRGSFSWINTRFLDPVGQSQAGRVLGEDVAIRIGSELTNIKPTVEAKSKLKRGTQVVLLDTRPVYNEEGGWLPIAPTTDEVRYIPADAIKSTPQVQHVQSSPASGAAPGAGAAPADPASTALHATGSDEALWQQARQAEQAGHAADASDLYLQLARRTTDHDLQMRCYNRMNFLRQGTVPGAPAAYQPPQTSAPPAYYAPPTMDNRLIPTPSYNQVPVYPASRVPRSQYVYQPYQTVSRVPAGSTPTPAVNYAPPAVQAPPATPPISSPAPQSSGPGWLRPAAFNMFGQRAYVLVDQQGIPMMYVTVQSGSGLNLAPFVNHVVDLWGVKFYDGPSKKDHMQVIQARIVQ